MSILKKLAAFEPERLERQRKTRRAWRWALVAWILYALSSFLLAWVLARR